MARLARSGEVRVDGKTRTEMQPRSGDLGLDRVDAGVHQKYREDAQWMRKDEGYHGDQELVAEAHRIAGDEGWSVAEVLDSGERIPLPQSTNGKIGRASCRERV